MAVFRLLNINLGGQSFQETVVANRTRRDPLAGAASNGGPGHPVRSRASGGRVREGRPRGRKRLCKTVTGTAGD